MSEVNLQALSKANEEYKQLSDLLKTKYDCSWDDSVHESFRGYIKSVEKSAENFNQNNKSAETILASAESLQVDKLEHMVSSLINEVNAL